MDVVKLVNEIKIGDFGALARALTLVENNHDFAFELLKLLPSNSKTPIIGITGPPGAGKSTLINTFLNQLSGIGKKVAVLAVDPSSPFHQGALLGDRFRMVKQFNNQNVFIRSIANRGVFGGLSAKAVALADVLKAGIFDLIIIETVGVGQSEIEITSVADCTLVVLVPESGDEIQHIKSGIMEIADAYVVNKCDRDGADGFGNSLVQMIDSNHLNVPVFKTNAETGEGTEELIKWFLSYKPQNKQKKDVLVKKSLAILIDKIKELPNVKAFEKLVEKEIESNDFNLYNYVDKWLNEEFSKVYKK